MPYRNLYTMLLLLWAVSLSAQKAASTAVNQTNLNLRGGPKVAAQVSLIAPGPGKVIVRFDGVCYSSPGDRIILAASNTTSWGMNDGCIELESASDDINSNTFSHTRAYDVQAGSHTFYAVAENTYETDGSGVASLSGHLTAEWYPEEPGKPFARHIGFYSENIPVEGAPVPFNALTINAPEAGKVLLRFDGKCVSSYGDLMYFAASNNLAWTNYEGSTSNEVIDNDLNRFSFSHARVYDVTPGNHTFYAVAENFFETYGNGFANIYGSLTAVYYPNSAQAKVYNKAISTPFGIQAEGPISTLGQTVVDAPVSGQMVVNLLGTGIGSFGDKIRIGVSDTQNWEPQDGSITFEPFSSDLNRTSFSHTRVYQVSPGSHTYFANIQNIEEFEGSGLSVVYTNLNVEYFPDGSVATTEPLLLQNVRVFPNPATDFVSIEMPDLATEEALVQLLDPSGRVLMTRQKSASESLQQIRWNLANLPQGMYLIQVNHASGTVTRKLVK
ncbi:MAG TPA: T9SS type A sorting domain-containing protein [Saprospiraceae bacterium]|nr:T9SS type A sorting domain-containing protein [Saprospiraceae bacterium]